MFVVKSTPFLFDSPWNTQKSIRRKMQQPPKTQPKYLNLFFFRISIMLKGDSEEERMYKWWSEVAVALANPYSNINDWSILVQIMNKKEAGNILNACHN